MSDRSNAWLSVLREKGGHYAWILIWTLLKGLYVYALILVTGSCAIVTLLDWSVGRGDLWWRLKLTGASLVAAVLLYLSCRMSRKVEVDQVNPPDLAPDFLRRIVEPYYEKDGLCFAIVPRVDGSLYWFDVYFQNRYERPSLTYLVIQPSKEFLLDRRPISAVSLEIESAGGAFGVARVPLAIPLNFQGRTQSFDLTATNSARETSGNVLRYAKAIQVETPSRESSKLLSILAIVLMGHLLIHYRRATRFKTSLPFGVDDTLPACASVSIETLWRLSDPPTAIDDKLT